MKRNVYSPARHLAQLRQSLASALLDLEQEEGNLAEVESHLQASRDGRVDEVWWEAAMRSGAWHFEVGCEYRMGSYPSKVISWMRHLRSTLHLEAYRCRGVVDDLRAKLARLEPLTLPTLEAVPAERETAAAVALGEDLTLQLLAPAPSISRAAGVMEVHSPLFRESAANPQLSLFGGGL